MELNEKEAESRARREAALQALHDENERLGLYDYQLEPKCNPHPTHQPQRKPLTDEQIDEIYFKSSLEVDNRCEDIYDFVRAIEAAHGIKE